MAVHMREVLVRPNLVPRAFPLKNGWEKPWGRGWVRPWIGVRVSFALQASSVCLITTGAPNDNFRKNICSEDDLRSRIFGTFAVKFLAFLPLLGFSNI